MQTQNLVWGVGCSRMAGTFLCFCHLLCNKHSAVCFYSSFGVQQNNTVVTTSRTIKLLLNTLLSLLLTEYKLISNCWAWESLEEYRKFIDILLGSSLVWWQAFVQRVRSVQQEMCCSCGCIHWCDRVCSLHKGRQNHQLCPTVPISHSCQSVSALTSLPCLWSRQLCLAGHPMWDCSGRITAQKQGRVWWPCSLQRALPGQQEESKHLESQLSLICTR